MIEHSSTQYAKLMQRADVFLVTSRLDPLPNVAIDALISEHPVMCFDKACGLASLFKEDKKLRESLLVPYLDSGEMAKMLSSLLENDDTRREIGDYCMHKAKQWFDMESYIRKIQQLGERAKIEQKEIAKNFKYLIEMNAINMEYCYKNEINKEYCTQHYLYSWKNNIGKRKPFPGFHPGIYKEKAIDINSKEDPLVHYLKSGKPKGEWFSNLIESNKKRWRY